jgi:hypothetical protein
MIPFLVTAILRKKSINKQAAITQKYLTGSLHSETAYSRARVGFQKITYYALIFISQT